jgi:glyoxylase-like metal-dependent hydrolase (beta-lactamase superfamily II)
MIKIKRFECNMIQENCYVVSDDSHEAVVIDCGAYYAAERKAVTDYIDHEQLTVVHLLCTHGHFDHCFGNDTIWHHCGTLPKIPAGDEWLSDISLQMEQMMGIPYDGEVTPIGQYYSPKDYFTFGSHKLTVLHTPGHTPGSSCFYCAEENVLFTGDTLFRLSIGRTDFPRGSWSDMQNSLTTVLAKLPTETVVMPGHGPQTTIADELQMNPYMR